MLLSKIMTAFHNYERQWICQFNKEIDIYSFSFLTKGCTFDSNVLYFGNVSDLPADLPDLNLTFVCIRDAEFPVKYHLDYLSQINLITLDKSTDQMDILLVLTQIFGNAAKISSGRSHLIELLHSNQGLQAIIDKTYEILQNPIIVVDSSYKILAMYQDTTFSLNRQDLEEQRSLGYMLKSNIDAMNAEHIYELARAKGYPLYNKSSDSNAGWITSLVYIHGIEVGQIGVMENQHAFSDVDFELIDFLSKVVSLELQKSDFYRTSQGLMHSYLLSDLLENNIHDADLVKHRMFNLGWDFSSNLYVMLLTDSTRTFFDGKAQLISRQLHQILPGSRWVIYHGQIVFLIKQDETIDAENTSKLYQYLEINQLSASFSNRFDNIINLKKYYNQAKKAFSFGKKLHSDQHVYHYSDYFFYHMGEIVSEQYDLSDFYHPAIIAINDYDAEHNTNFLETLQLYLTYIDQPGIIAEKLFVHKNTIFYRINKLKEQFDLHLENGEERFKIQTTIKLMKLK